MPVDLSEASDNGSSYAAAVETWRSEARSVTTMKPLPNNFDYSTLELRIMASVLNEEEIDKMHVASKIKTEIKRLREEIKKHGRPLS